MSRLVFYSIVQNDNVSFQLVNSWHEYLLFSSHNLRAHGYCVDIGGFWLNKGGFWLKSNNPAQQGPYAIFTKFKPLGSALLEAQEKN